MRRGDPEAQTETHVVRGSEARLEEAAGLARAIDLVVAEALIAPVSQIRPATYLGKGKVEEITGLVKGHDIELVVMDCALSPIQQRNLEKAWNTKVLDRTGLILEIFGRRAKTKEGSLQVELAHLNYQRSRLVRSWTHLERQRGGFGFMGGPMQAAAGLALLGTLGASLAGALADEEGREAAVVFFLVAASGITVLAVGSAFWALVAGLMLRPLLREVSAPRP